MFFDAYHVTFFICEREEKSKQNEARNFKRELCIYFSEDRTKGEGEEWGVRVKGGGEGWRWTVVFPPFSVYRYCSVSFLQNIRFLLTFRKRCEIISKTMTGNRTVLQDCHPRPSPPIPHPSPLTPHPSPLTPHPSPLTPHPSPLTPHPSPLTPHTRNRPAEIAQINIKVGKTRLLSLVQLRAQEQAFT